MDAFNENLNEQQAQQPMGCLHRFYQNNQGCHHRIINSSPDDTDVHD